MFYNFFSQNKPIYVHCPKVSQTQKNIHKLKDKDYTTTLQQTESTQWTQTFLVRIAVAVLSSTNKPNTDTYLSNMKMLWGTVAV